MRHKNLSKTSKNDSHLSVLLSNYESSVSSFEKTLENILQLLGIGVAASAALVGYFAPQKILPFGAAWLIPLLVLFFYGVLIYTFHFQLSNLWNARVLEKRINMLLPEISAIRYVPEFPAARFFSTKRGSKVVAGLFAILVFMAASFFLALLYICFKSIYEVHHFYGTLFISTYSLIAIIELFALSTLGRDLPNLYYSLLRKIDDLERMPTEEEIKPYLLNLNQTAVNIVLLKIIPRPWDVSAKGIYFWLGYLFTYYLFGINSNSLPVLTTLFGKNNSWKSVGEVPIIAILGYGVLFFVLEELVLQQAKLIWDDIRDQKRDKELPLNKGRAVASGLMDTNSAISNLVARLVIAFAFPVLLGSPNVVLVFGLILLHQAVYVLWAKPRAKSHPIVLLFLLSFNTSLRFIAGVVVAASFAPLSSMYIVFIIIIIYLNSLSNSALFWRVEAEHLLKLGESEKIRPQSDYYLINGRKFQRIALFALVLLAFVLLFWNTQNIFGANVIYGVIKQYPAFRFLIGISLSIAVAYIFDTFILLFQKILRMLLKFVFGNRLETLFLKPFFLSTKKLYLSTLPLAGNLLLLGGILFGIKGLKDSDINLLIWAFLIFNGGVMILSENADFLDYTMARMKEQLSTFATLLYVYSFTPNSGISLITLFSVLLNYEYTQTARKFINQENINKH